MNNMIRKVKRGIRRILRWLKKFLFGFKATAIYCPYCKSYDVAPITESQILNDGTWHETYNLKCRDCHAVAHVTEVWRKEEK